MKHFNYHFLNVYIYFNVHLQHTWPLSFIPPLSVDGGGGLVVVQGLCLLVGT